MHVLHVASGREWRGGQRQTWLLALHLTRLGVRQMVVTGRTGELYRRLRRAGVPVHGCSWKAGIDPRALLGVFREARRRPAVLHAHDPHALAIAAIVTRALGLPLVVTRRATFPLRRPAAWRRADRVVAISEAVRRRLLADGIPADRIALVPSGIDLDDASSALPGGFRTRLALPTDSPLVATVAALTAEKGLDVLVSAASRLREQTPKIHWAVAGAGPLAPSLNRSAAELGVADVVHLLGHLDDPGALVAEADCYVMPSTSEAFGTSLLDAMALGRPIVASAVGGIPEVLGDAGLTVPPSDPAALAAAVARVTGDAALAARLGTAARTRVERFSAAGMARSMAAVYRSVAQID